ncbi:MAG: Glycerophosphoryl diester phosphodiesterase precursor, partial [Pseudomonadota bacterium]
MEDLLVAQLHAAYGNNRDAPVFIQSFEVNNLQYMRSRTKLRVVQLLSANGQPYDFQLSGDKRSYKDLASPQGLDFLKGYVDGIGAHTQLIVPTDGRRLLTPTLRTNSYLLNWLAVQAPQRPVTWQPNCGCSLKLAWMDYLPITQTWAGRS